jgi:hypothetical protein
MYYHICCVHVWKEFLFCNTYNRLAICLLFSILHEHQSFIYNIFSSVKNNKFATEASYTTYVLLYRVHHTAHIRWKSNKPWARGNHASWAHIPCTGIPLSHRPTQMPARPWCVNFPMDFMTNILREFFGFHFFLFSRISKQCRYMEPTCLICILIDTYIYDNSCKLIY